MVTVRKRDRGLQFIVKESFPLVWSRQNFNHDRFNPKAACIADILRSAGTVRRRRLVGRYRVIRWCYCVLKDFISETVSK